MISVHLSIMVFLQPNGNIRLCLLCGVIVAFGSRQIDACDASLILSALL